MIGILGTFGFDVWLGPPPPLVKSTVELIYRPGQAVAAAKILPNQSHESSFEAIAIVSATSTPFATDAAYKATIGTVVALSYGGVSYGNVLVKDAMVTEITRMIAAAGVHPNGTAYAYSGPYRIRSRWTIVRLS
jgi:hypothetical protein